MSYRLAVGMHPVGGHVTLEPLTGDESPAAVRAPVRTFSGVALEMRRELLRAGKRGETEVAEVRTVSRVRQPVLLHPFHLEEDGRAQVTLEALPSEVRAPVLLQETLEAELLLAQVAPVGFLWFLELHRAANTALWQGAVRVLVMLPR